jgi:cell volume regulation protein A
VPEDVLLTLGVSLILFYGGLNLSVEVLRRVWLGLGLLVPPGVVVTALLTGLVAYLVFDLSFTAAVLLGAVLAPTDPAILIPLFIRSRLRPKVAQTVIAESAINDPTGPSSSWTWGSAR